MGNSSSSAAAAAAPAGRAFDAVVRIKGVERPLREVVAGAKAVLVVNTASETLGRPARTTISGSFGAGILGSNTKLPFLSVTSEP